MPLCGEMGWRHWDSQEEGELGCGGMLRGGKAGLEGLVSVRMKGWKIEECLVTVCGVDAIQVWKTGQRENMEQRSHSLLAHWKNVGEAMLGAQI